MFRRTAGIYRELIRLGPLSNQELSQVLDLSPAGVTQTLKPLLNQGIFHELSAQQYQTNKLSPPEPGKRPRRKTTITPNKNYGYTIGGILRGTELELRKLDFDLELDEQKWTIQLDPDRPIAGQIIPTLKTIRDTNSTPLLAIGLSVSGRVELGSNTIVYSHNLPYLVGVDLGAELEEDLHVPSIVINDSHALGMGERFAGEAKHMDHFLTLFIDEGVGMGIVIDGKPYQGFDDLAGEAGQYILVPQGRSHKGTADGSFEAYISQEALWEQLKPLSKGRQENEKSCYPLLAALVSEKHPKALAIGEMIGEKIGLLATNLMLLFSPEMIFLTGPLAELGQELETPIQKAIRLYGPKSMSQAMAKRIRIRDKWQQRMVIGTGLAAIEAHLNNLDQQAQE